MLFFFQINTKYTMCEKNVELLTVKPVGSFCILATRTSVVDDSLASDYLCKFIFFLNICDADWLSIIPVLTSVIYCLFLRLGLACILYTQYFESWLHFRCHLHVCHHVDRILLLISPKIFA